MLDFLLILLVSGIMVMADYMSLKKEKKLMIAYLSLIVIGLSLFLAEMLMEDVPNPLNVIVYLFKPLTEMIMSLFK
ncbi:hypothetical protein FIU87_03125 [Bacillus sp. THAF10]|uniref:hypothetical protein n=1 Tax=Bacillus sp. THAF10 TaxID=2587848 RepID=UPI001268B415|nr:hypothetical protein [Bacillus sp. THAF10]QFT87633.1 hypothetical protein FIU87_03125 [Bacillus sp. THAF10]